MPTERRDLRCEVEELYAAYVGCLDDGELERWPEFFADACLYKILPRENFERGLPLGLVLCESKGMLQDRVAALRRTSVYAPRALRHLVTNFRIMEEGGALRVRANYAVFETQPDDVSKVFITGRYIDLLVREDGQLRFKEKLCVLDGNLIQGSLIYPI